MVDKEFDFDAVVGAIADNYETTDEIFFTERDRTFPSRTKIIQMIEDIRRVMFPGYFGEEALNGTRPQYFVGSLLAEIRDTLTEQLQAALPYRDKCFDECHKLEGCAEQIADDFISRLPEVQQMLFKDVEAAFDGDPAATGKEDVIFSYPGVFAVFVYRIAHELYTLDVPLIPRIMTEYAHGKTGVDINAGATIGEYFFIDHATGVVIGETTEIGNHVKIYQGVTLGALSTRAGQLLRGKKRHPTIEDNVTIYSNASILGGETVIGEGAIIGGSAFVTTSVPKHGRVSVKNQDLEINYPKDARDSKELDI